MAKPTPPERRRNEVLGTITATLIVSADEDGDVRISIDEIPGRVPLTTGDLEYIKWYGVYEVPVQDDWKDSLMQHLATRPNRSKP